MSVLQLSPLPETAEDALRRQFDVIGPASWRAQPKDSIDETVFGIASNAKGTIDKDLMDRLPNLRVIACFGAATDYVDKTEANRRGIRVSNTSRALADDVADFAIGQMLGLVRGIAAGHQHVASGSWMTSPTRMTRSLTGLNLGIVGLGAIGLEISSRASAFKMQIGYHNRRPAVRTDARYFGSVLELATWADILVLSCPGGAETQGLIDGTILQALGPRGFLVNIARGSVVKQTALFQALQSGAIAGAALDVFETEPFAPTKELPNLLLTPHAASSTEESRQRMATMMIQSLIDVTEQIRG